MSVDFGDRVDFMSLLSAESRRRVDLGSMRETCRAGGLVHHAGDEPRAFIVERGLMRIFWSDDQGRQTTVAYSGTGELIGATTIMGHQWAGASVQGVVDTRLLHLDVAAAQIAVATELDFCAAIATHLAAVTRNALRLVALRTMGTLSQRLAYDLLERACRQQLETGRLETHATHGELADSIGSSREVVSRAVRDLRAAGTVITAPRCINVAKPLVLERTLRAFRP